MDEESLELYNGDKINDLIDLTEDITTIIIGKYSNLNIGNVLIVLDTLKSSIALQLLNDELEETTKNT